MKNTTEIENILTSEKNIGQMTADLEQLIAKRKLLRDIDRVTQLFDAIDTTIKVGLKHIEMIRDSYRNKKNGEQI